MPEFDFSQFHDIQHQVFSPYCFRQYGGPIRHIKLWYDYKFEWPWFKKWHKYRCNRNIHTWVDFWEGPKIIFEDEPTGQMCEYCWTVKED